MAGNKDVNSNLNILGKATISTLPNSSGNVVTWNSISKELSQRTNSEFISDLALATESWVTSQNYLTNAALSGYATENWVINNYVTTNTPQTINASKTFIGNTFVQSRFAVKGNDGNDWIILHGGLRRGVIKNPENISQEVRFIGWLSSTDYPYTGNFPYFGFNHASSRVVVRTNLDQHTDKALAVGGPSYIESISTQSHGDSSQWKQAFDWGDHASAGYLTSASLSGYATQNWVTSQGYITNAALSGYATETWVINNVWHAGNDGSGSGLDADLLDGLHSSSFLVKAYNNATLGNNLDWNTLTYQDNSIYFQPYHTGNYAGQTNHPNLSGYGTVLTLPMALTQSAFAHQIVLDNAGNLAIRGEYISNSFTTNFVKYWNTNNFNPANYVQQSSLNTTLGNYVTVNGVQDITATKTFTVSPIVPNGTLGNHAVNLNQLNGKENAFAKNSAFNKNFGTTAGTVAEGNHTHSGYLNQGLNIDVSAESNNLRINPFEVFLDGSGVNKFDGSEHPHRLVYIILSDGASGLSLENLQPKQRIVIFNISGNMIGIKEDIAPTQYILPANYKVSAYKIQNSYYSANSAIFYDKTELTIW